MNKLWPITRSPLVPGTRAPPSPPAPRPGAQPGSPTAAARPFVHSDPAGSLPGTSRAALASCGAGSAVEKGRVGREEGSGRGGERPSASGREAEARGFAEHNGVKASRAAGPWGRTVSRVKRHLVP